MFGQSLGGAMAATVLGDAENQGAADCVVLEAAFASYRGITNDVMKGSWLLWPLRWLVLPGMPGTDLDPESRIAGVAPTPLLVMHSEDDPIIPYDHGKRLFAAASEPKTFQRLRGGHIESTRDPSVQQRIVDFLQHNGCAAPAPAPPARDDGMDGLAPLPLPPAPTGNNGYRF